MTRELQWLARRAATRHVAEPLIDAHWKPNALILHDGDEGIAYDPRSQFTSLFDAEITRHDDHVVVLAPGADGRPVKTYQSFLVLGSLPDHPSFPDPGIELMSAPLAQLDFPVDSVLHAEWIANKRAIAEVRTAIKDAGIALEDAVAGKTTLDDDQLDLQDLGRRAIAYLKGSEKPPLVETVLELAVGAGSLKELQRRVDALREVYGGVVLHHLTAKQEGMYYDHLPRTGGARMRMHRNLMNADLLGALMPTATQHVGHDRGVYVGFTVDLSGSASTPIRWDLTAPAKDNLPTSCYFGGQMGSGKTTAAQLFGALAALMGSIVLTVDPKPDHNITALEILAGPHTGREPRGRRALPRDARPARMRAASSAGGRRDLLPAGDAAGVRQPRGLGNEGPRRGPRHRRARRRAARRAGAPRRRRRRGARGRAEAADRQQGWPGHPRVRGRHRRHRSAPESHDVSHARHRTSRRIAAARRLRVV
jgi:hypothetical protein